MKPIACQDAGAASIAWPAGLTRVDTSSYAYALMAAGALCLVASIVVAFIGRHGGAPASTAPAQNPSQQ